MSVRRLAEEQVQPASFAFSQENAVWAEKTIRKYPAGRQQSAVIPLLMRAQEQDGWVTKAAIESIADMLDMAYIRVLEVATFYTQFQLKPVGKYAHIQVCGTTPCMLRGSEELIKICKKRIHPEPFALNSAETLSWEEVECQGACVNAPMVMIFKDSYEDLSVEQFEHIIDSFEAGRGADIKPGPQIDRIYSAPEGGPVALTSPDYRYRNQVTEPEAASPSKGAGEGNGEGAGTSVPPANAARAKDNAPETDASVKTPVTAKPEAAENAKASANPLSGTTDAKDPDVKPVGSNIEGAPAEKGAVEGKTSAQASGDNSDGKKL